MTGLQHKDDYFCTPDWLYNKIEKETGLRFQTDMCASENNSKCSGYIDEELNALDHDYSMVDYPIFCNPPRSKNGKFVNKVYEIWKEYGYDIVMLLCWNDFGNKYSQDLLNQKIGTIEIHNIGKVKFYKNGIESKFPSRLTYCWVWFKARDNQ